jgi:hypothetical protein
LCPHLHPENVGVHLPSRFYFLLVLDIFSPVKTFLPHF